MVLLNPLISSLRVISTSSYTTTLSTVGIARHLCRTFVGPRVMSFHHHNNATNNNNNNNNNNNTTIKKPLLSFSPPTPLHFQTMKPADNCTLVLAKRISFPFESLFQSQLKSVLFSSFSTSPSTFTSTSTSTSTCSPLVVQLHQKTLSPPCFTFLSSNSIPTGKTPSFSMSSTSCRPFTSLSPSSTSLSSNKPFYSNRSSSHYNRSGSSSSNSSNDLNPILSALRLSGIFILALGITYLLLPVLIPLLVLLLCALVAAGLYFYRMRRNFFNTLNNSLKQHSNSTSPFSSSSSSTPTPPFPSSLFGRIFSPLQQPSSFDQSPLINLLQSFASKALSFDQFDNVFSLSSKLISNDPVAMRRLEEARRKHGGSSFTITPFQHNIQVDVQSNGSAQRVVIPKAVFQGPNSNNNGRSPAEPISVSIVARIISNAATTSSSSTTTVIGDNMVEIKSIKLGFPETQEEINVDLNGTTHKTEPNKRGKIIDAEVRDQ